jgi:hypothetical protein
MTSDYVGDEARGMLRRKEAWHRAEASRPVRENVRILLALQRQDLPLLSRHRPLRPWERPWAVDP